VRSEDNPEGGIGAVLAWDDPRCLFSPEDSTGHTAVAWEDESVTIVADGALNPAGTVDWDEEAEEPEDLAGPCLTAADFKMFVRLARRRCRRGWARSD
jgi:hypothetical protein